MLWHVMVIPYYGDVLRLTKRVLRWLLESLEELDFVIVRPHKDACIVLCWSSGFTFHVRADALLGLTASICNRILPKSCRNELC